MTKLTARQGRPIAGAVALVTGANRGLGAAYARELLGRGAARVYAAVRDPATITDPRLIAVQLDLTDRVSIARAASRAQDVTLVINHAGVLTGVPTLGDEAGLREELEVNYLGPVAVTRAFAPILAANGGGALVNVLSVLSWLSFPGSGGYSSAKAAMWAATDRRRIGWIRSYLREGVVHHDYRDHAALLPEGPAKDLLPQFYAKYELARAAALEDLRQAWSPPPVDDAAREGHLRHIVFA